MKNLKAVICEYNPFHRGHALQISRMQERGTVIALMSGSFTQRGEVSVLSKYEKAETAILGGCDLVLELPFPYCSANAEIFGSMGIRILNGLFPTCELCFGSESHDLSFLQNTVERMQGEAFSEALLKTLSENRHLSHRGAVMAAYRSLYGDAALPSGSNDLLALSYLAAIQKQNSEISPVPVKREGETYGGDGGGIPSAGTIRKLLAAGGAALCKNAVPETTFLKLKEAEEGGKLAREERIYPLFASLIRGRGPEMLSDSYDTPKELASRMARAALSCRDYPEFLETVKTRQYSASRIRRSVLYTLLHVTKDCFSEMPFTTVLAANEKGRNLLSEIRKTNMTVPIVTKPADFLRYPKAVADAYALVNRADGLRELLLDNPGAGDETIRRKPYITK